jgi:hypothetical protein
MKKIFIAAVLAMCPLAATADTTSTLKLALDRNLSNEKVSESMIRSDGTLYGKYQGKAYDGTWELKGGEYCRKISNFKIDGCQNVVPITDADGKLTGIRFVDLGKTTGNPYYFD